MKFFNTAGPINQEEHYKIDPLTRWDLDEITSLIEQKKYFILHAPRQTGKTSCMLALQEKLNGEGNCHCLYANIEAAQSARNDVARGIHAVLTELNTRLINTLGDKAKSILSSVNLPKQILEQSGPETALNEYLKQVCSALQKPLVVFFDEIDALIGDTLVSVLRQLRSGYDVRPSNFPSSVILCGVRDIKDYRIHTSNNEIITGGSCFNIKSESLTLGNFSLDEVKELYHQHTKYGGQLFDEECFPYIMKLTDGQPWLVNALAYEVTWKMKENRDPAVTITSEMISIAKERLILSRQTHLDQLADKLSEERVRRVIEPMLSGDLSQAQEDDTEYCKDLGLIKKTPHGYVVSNDIYQEIIPRELSKISQDKFLSLFKPDWVNADKTINTTKLFTMFQEFWRENSEIWGRDMAGYLEAAPHLTFQAFLQRIANGSGQIIREYAYGTKRADLVLKWTFPGGEQRIVIELKMRRERDNYEKLKADALEQTAIYSDLCDATESHIVIFDRCEKTNWKEKIFSESCKYKSLTIKIWGM